MAIRSRDISFLNAVYTTLGYKCHQFAYNLDVYSLSNSCNES